MYKLCVLQFCGKQIIFIEEQEHGNKKEREDLTGAWKFVLKNCKTSQHLRLSPFNTTNDVRTGAMANVRVSNLFKVRMRSYQLHENFLSTLFLLFLIFVLHASLMFPAISSFSFFRSFLSFSFFFKQSSSRAIFFQTFFFKLNKL